MILSDGNFQLGSNGLIKYQDITDLLNYYNEFFNVTVDMTPPANANVLKNIFNELQSVINSGSVYYDVNIYQQLETYMNMFKSGSLIENIIFPKLTWIPVYKTFEITRDTTFTVPRACKSITINYLIAGGGGGAWGSGEMYGWDNHWGLWLYWGGSGGSGGSYQNYNIDVKYLDTISIKIGTGGTGANIHSPNLPNNELRHAGFGTNSSISLNNTIIIDATGGTGGMNSTPGTGGIPNGHNGGWGSWGRKHKEHSGNWGASSIIPNTGGHPGGYSNRDGYGQPAGDGYKGGGGGSGGYSYRGGGISQGGNGGNGYCSISLYCPIFWTI